MPRSMATEWAFSGNDSSWSDMLDTSAVLFSWPLSLGCCNVELEGVAGEREGDTPV